MKLLIAICIILLGLEVVRFAISSVIIIIAGKIGDKQVGPVMRILNLVNAIGITVGYIILVIAYYPAS